MVLLTLSNNLKLGGNDMKKCRYYIAFSHSKGIGYSIMDVKGKIKSIEDINNLIRDIEAINKLDTVIILNWIKLSR